jgi:hypothetical protein
LAVFFFLQSEHSALLADARLPHIHTHGPPDLAISVRIDILTDEYILRRIDPL